MELQIFQNIEKHIDLSDEEKHVLKSLLVVKRVLKNELVQYQGDACSKIYFVESGSLYAFHQSDTGKQSTIMFAIKDWWITDMDAFVNDVPAKVNIAALEDSRIVKLSSADLEDLYDKIPKFERFFRVLFQNAYIREQQRAFCNITYSTQQNYQRFLKNYPAISEKITQKQIASYLGVTPEFLSSIKKSTGLKLS